MLEWLFSWEVSSWVIGGAVGVAFAVLALDDFGLAKLFFLIAAADASGGVVMWTVKTTRPSWQVYFMAFVLAGGIGVLGAMAFRYVNTKRNSKMGSATPPNNSAPSPTPANPAGSSPLPTPTGQPAEAPKKKLRPMKDPLEIVAFNSNQSISILNNGPLSVYILNLETKSTEPILTQSYGLGFDVGPGNVYQYQFKQEDSEKLRTIDKLGSTWKEHLERATALYQTCGGIKLRFFSPSDPGFKVVKDFYSQNNQELIYGDASASLVYRVHGFDETKEQPVPVVVMIMVNDGCPHYTQ